MKKILPLIGILLVAAALFFISRHAPEKSRMENAPVDVSISAPALFAEFMEDESAANEKYLNKVVVVSGTVQNAITNKSGGMPTLHFETKNPAGKVICVFDPQTEHARPEFHPGEQLSLKCTCMDFYRDVKLVDCVFSSAVR